MIETIYTCDVCGQKVDGWSLYHAKYRNDNRSCDAASIDMCEHCLDALRQRVKEKRGMNGPLYEGAK